jgi:hypothetical protein
VKGWCASGTSSYLDKELKQVGYGLLLVLLNAVEPRSSHILSLT